MDKTNLFTQLHIHNNSDAYYSTYDQPNKNDVSMIIKTKDYIKYAQLSDNLNDSKFKLKKKNKMYSILESKNTNIPENTNPPIEDIDYGILDTDDGTPNIEDNQIIKIVNSNRYYFLDDSLMKSTQGSLIGGYSTTGYSLKCPKNDLIFRFGIDISDLQASPSGISMSSTLGLAITDKDDNGEWIFNRRTSIPYSGEGFEEILVKVHFNNESDMTLYTHISTPVIFGTYIKPYMICEKVDQTKEPQMIITL